MPKHMSVSSISEKKNAMITPRISESLSNRSHYNEQLQ
jgi:hypothetical protein